MKRQLILLALFCLAAMAATAQNNASDAQARYKECDLKGDLAGAKKHCMAYLKENPTDPNAGIDLAAYHLFEGNVDSAFYYLFKEAETDSSTAPISCGEFYSLLSYPQWDSLVCLQIAKEEACQHAHYDKGLARLMANLYVRDQAGWKEENFFPERSDSIQYAKDSILNPENIRILDSVFAASGWPGISKVGGILSSAPFLIVQHCEDLPKMKYYLKVLRKAVKKGEAAPSNYAYLYDRVHIFSGKKQLYGTQCEPDENGELIVSPIRRPKGVDKRRAKVGLYPLERYLEFCRMYYTAETDETEETESK